MESIKKFFGEKLKETMTDAFVDLMVTAVVLQFIQVKFADQQINWNLVVKKGQGWLNKESTKLNSNIDWAVTSNEYLKSVKAL